MSCWNVGASLVLALPFTKLWVPAQFFSLVSSGDAEIRGQLRALIRDAISSLSKLLFRLQFGILRSHLRRQLTTLCGFQFPPHTKVALKLTQVSSIFISRRSWRRRASPQESFRCCLWYLLFFLIATINLCGDCCFNWFVAFSGLSRFNWWQFLASGCYFLNLFYFYNLFYDFSVWFPFS